MQLVEAVHLALGLMLLSTVHHPQGSSQTTQPLSDGGAQGYSTPGASVKGTVNESAHPGTERETVFLLQEVPMDLTT